jgi:NAD(P)-dependent dehydrogenase (short-subunit alcohol dehydrogenase family)
VQPVPPLVDLALGPDLFGLDGKVVWITGASRGIGAAVAAQLGQSGARLVLQARTATDLELVRAKVEADGAEVAVVIGSVTDEDAVARAVDTAVSKWGRLDGLVNNAGISPVMRRSEALDVADWRAICEVNLTGAFIASAAAARQMLPQGRGSIVSVSSVHGHLAAPRLAAYAASKGGLDMLTRTLAVEWAGSGVRVNAVAPGYVETEMTEGLRRHERWSRELIGKVPLGRFATTQEIVGAVHFLLSDASRYMTGSVLAVDGGWSAQ